MRVALCALVCFLASSSARADAVTDRLTAAVQDGVALGYPAVGLRVETVDGRSETIARGFANLSTGQPLQPQHRFVSFSITKVFVGVLIHQLVEQGRLSLSTKMIDVLGVGLVGRIQHASEISVGQLLNHSSGVYDIFDDPAFRAATNGRNAEVTKVWTGAELIAYAYDKPALARPGVGSHYSNTNYDLLGLIVEEVTGKSVHTLLFERIFHPLDMNDTFLAGHGTQKDYITGYAPNSQLLRDAGFDYPFPAVGNDHLDVSALNYSYEWAAGGIVSNLGDLAKFARALSSGNLLSPASLATMKTFTPALRTVRVGDFALGYGLEALGTPVAIAIGHSGSGLGFTTMMYQADGDGTIVVAFANSVLLSGAGEYFIRLFSEAVDAARSPEFGN